MIAKAVAAALASGAAGLSAGAGASGSASLPASDASTSSDAINYKARCDLLENALSLLTRKVDVNSASDKIFYLKMFLTQTAAPGSYTTSAFEALLELLYKDR